jgi:CBS domain-containing protein
LKLEKEEEREGEMMRRKVVIRFPIDPMSEALVEVNQTIKASAELVAKETAIERVPVVEEEAKVDKEDEGQTRELRGQFSFVPGLFQKTFNTSSYLLKSVKGD